MALRPALKRSVHLYSNATATSLIIGTRFRRIEFPNRWGQANTKYLIELFDGKREVSQIAQLAGVAPENIEALIEELRAHNLIDLYRTPISYLERYNPDSGVVEKIVDIEEFPSDYAIQSFLNRVEVECDAATFNAGDVDAGRSAVLDRASFQILIFGKGRVVNALVGILSAAGFSNVNVINRLRPRHPALKMLETDIAGGYVTHNHIGQSRRQTLQELRSSNALFKRQLGEITNPDLVISIGSPSADAMQRWISEGTPHLLVEIGSSAEVRVGPLVIPGKSPCMRCIELTQTGDEKIAPVIERAEVGAALSFAIASSIVADVSLISAGEKSVFLATSITYFMSNFHQPNWQHWGFHPGCGCNWS